MHNLKFTAESWCQCGELEQNLLRPLFLCAVVLWNSIFFFSRWRKLTILWSKKTGFVPILLLYFFSYPAEARLCFGWQWFIWLCLKLAHFLNNCKCSYVPFLRLCVLQMAYLLKCSILNQAISCTDQKKAGDECFSHPFRSSHSLSSRGHWGSASRGRLRWQLWRARGGLTSHTEDVH